MFLPVSPCGDFCCVSQPLVYGQDADGDGCVTRQDDLPPPGANFEMRMNMGTPAQMLEYQRRLFTRSPEQTGTILPPGMSDVQPGYLLVHEVGDRGDMQKSQRTYLLDDQGQVAHEWKTSDRHPEATVAYLRSDGNLVKTTCRYSWLEMDGMFPIGANGRISIIAPDSAVLWQWDHIEFGHEVLHHDIELMPNGNILAICYKSIPVEKAYALGWRHQRKRKTIVLDKIVEIKPDTSTGATEIVWEWSTEDHLIQDTDASLPHYGRPIDNPHRIDVNWLQLGQTQFNSGQLFHANSVSYNAAEDIILLSSATYSEIWAIDHSTTSAQARTSRGGRYDRGGDLLWRYGNPQTHQAGDASDQILYWQHDAHFINSKVPKTGEILIYNNGMKRNANGAPEPNQICMGLITGAYSDVMEISLPRDASDMIKLGAPPEVHWHYNKDGKQNLYSPFMSGVQRLPNGNTLMCQACDKRVLEVTADGKAVLDFKLGGPGRLFRLYKLVPEHSGIRALKL